MPCELHVEPGMYHGADQLLLKNQRMEEYRNRMVTALRVRSSAEADESTG